MRIKEVLTILCLIFLISCSSDNLTTNFEVNVMALKISSPVFDNHGKIPKNYSCLGENINPPLKFENIPSGARSLVLIMDDPDAPAGTWIHWVLFDIPVSYEIKENSVPENAIQGRNSWNMNSYGGPCPPSGTHRYFFKLYALDVKTLGLDPTADAARAEQAMQSHIIEKAELVGLFSKF